jgi:hypothetical protein
MKNVAYGIALSIGMAMLAIDRPHAQPEPALPPKADLATLNCASIFNMKRTETVMVLAWLQRHYAPAGTAKIIDQEKIYNDGLKLNAFCESRPDKTVMEAADVLFGGQ